MANPYLSRLRLLVWADVGSLAAFAGVLSLGDPFGLEGVKHPALPLLFFLACITGLSVALLSLLVVIFGLLAGLWRRPLERGTGFTP